MKLAVQPQGGAPQTPLMRRQADFQGSRKPITAAVEQTITWSPADIPSAGIVGLSIGFLGGTTLGNVIRLKVKSSGVEIVNLSQEQLRTYLSRVRPNKALLPVGAQTFDVPLNAAWLMTGNYDQDAVQFPPASQCSVEITLNNTALAGFATLGWTITAGTGYNGRPALFRPRLYAFQLGFPIGAANRRYQLEVPGAMCGVSLPVRGIGRAMLRLGGITVFNLPGPVFQGSDAAPGNGHDALTAWQRGDDVYTPLAGSGRRWWLFNPTQAPSGSSFIELDLPTPATAANGWGGGVAGADVAEEIAILTLENA